MKKWLIYLIVALIPITALYGNSNILLTEDFNSLASWKQHNFPKIEKHSKYSIISENGKKYLKTESNASASVIVFRKTFNIFNYPVIKWKWKILNILKKGYAKEKSGDDYPIRVYVIFKYDPVNASLFEIIKYEAAKLIYGEYPPHSSLSYIWANKIHEERIITNSYSDKVRMILLRMGGALAGKWVEEEVNILNDYKEAFNEKPPAIASLAIMSDTDNTGERAEAYVDYIIISRKRK